MKPIQSPPGVAGAVKTRQRKRPDLTLPVPQRDVSLAVPLPLPPASSRSGSAPSSGGSAPSSGGSASSSSSSYSSSMNSNNDSAAKHYSDLERGSKIGSGAGGTVYKVVHRPTSRVYALKVIFGNYEDTVRQQICREIEILHDVNHPNVVKCHEMFNVNGEIQVLLEFMDKGSLEGAHVWKEQQLSDLSRQILCGLAYLHSRHIVHRDIKPSNLLINSAKNVKIADFGVSRVLAQTIDPCNSSVGTIAYMSPERINTDLNHGKYNGYAGDIWSLGLSILEFYLGRFPFPCGRQSDWSSLMCAICMAKPPEAPPTASPEFRHFISCCLQKDPARRRSAMQLLQHPFILGTSPNQNKSPQNLHQLLPPPRPLPSSSSPTT